MQPPQPPSNSHPQTRQLEPLLCTCSTLSDASRLIFFTALHTSVVVDLCPHFTAGCVVHLIADLVGMTAAVLRPSRDCARVWSGSYCASRSRSRRGDPRAVLSWHLPGTCPSAPATRLTSLGHRSVTSCARLFVRWDMFFGFVC